MQSALRAWLARQTWLAQRAELASLTNQSSIGLQILCRGLMNTRFVSRYIAMHALVLDMLVQLHPHTISADVKKPSGEENKI